MRQTMKLRALGVTFLALVLVAGYLVYAVFTQQFVRFDKVELRADHLGLQLPDRADVKVRGAIVGEVTDTRTLPGGGVALTLGLKPDSVSSIPSNVTASILPKTLFGEKYVALDVPTRPSATPLRVGDVIWQTKLPIEVEQVLSDIYPLLRTVQPAQLNYTLNALATALEGRGDQLGNNLQVLNGYLIKLNPEVPKLIDDLRLLQSVSNTYADVAPDLGRILRNSTKTGNTLLVKQARLHQFLRSTSAFSDTATSFLDANGDNIIRLGQVSEPTLALLAKYSSEYPCLLGGLVDIAPREASAFRNYTLHINLVPIPKQPRGYNTSDLPANNDKRGPYCGTLPHSPYSPQNIYHYDPLINGAVSGPSGPSKFKRTGTGFDSTFAGAATGTVAPSGVTGTPREKAAIVPLTAPVLGVPADQVHDISTLLFGPIARGSQVSMEGER